ASRRGDRLVPSAAAPVRVLAGLAAEPSRGPRMSGPVRVSVVIPAHDAEPFIRRTLDSARHQRGMEGRLEIVVVDDGSTDAAADRVRACGAEAGAPVRLLAGPRRGVSEARNEGVRHAVGDYIAFMDHDDLWEPDKLSRQAAQLDADPRLALVFTQARVVHDDVDGELFPILDDAAAFLEKAYENLVHWNYIPMSAGMVRAS